MYAPRYLSEKQRNSYQVKVRSHICANTGRSEQFLGVNQPFCLCQDGSGLYKYVHTGFSLVTHDASQRKRLLGIIFHLLHVPGAAESSNQDEWKQYGELRAFCPRRGVFVYGFHPNLTGRVLRSR